MSELYKKLKRKLISMELKPGDKLSENSIAAEENMSRPQVREALTVLSDERYLITLPQKGSVVTKLSKNMIREATHAHMILEQAILSELVSKRRAGYELNIINDYASMLRELKKPDDEYELVRLEWEFYSGLAKECDKEFAYSFLEKMDCDLYRLSALKYGTYNYSAYSSSLNAWENTMVEMKLMVDQLNNCQYDLVTMLCSNRYNGFMVMAEALSGIYGEYFE